jgi:hypothetical protein
MANDADALENSANPNPARRRRRTMDLSPAAQEEFQKLNATHALRVRELATNAARAKNADVVSKSDITFAANAMGMSITKKRYKVASDFGAGFIGAALAGGVAIVIADTYTFKTALAVGIPLLIGLALYIYSYAGKP